MNKQILYSYLAGIIDGEAYIGIKKSTWGMRNRPDIKSPTYSERVQIRMSCPEVLKIFKDNFGGRFYKEPKIYQSKNGFKSQKIMYIYTASDKIASKLIKSVLPYLIEKKMQAKYILELRKSKDSKEARLHGGPKQKRTMSDIVLNKREYLYQSIKNIHHPQ
jgi:hypothetical protein